jgi:Uma2 family endonuclease
MPMRATHGSITYPPEVQIIATAVTWEHYLASYAGDGCELVEGVVIKVSPVHIAHDNLTAFLRGLLDGYFELRPIGQVRSSPFVMRLPNRPRYGREPDVMVILNSNPGIVQNTYMDGAADLCIEVVSPGTEIIDYTDKLAEYEQGGVTEYWIIDPLQQACHFYRLSAEGGYARVHEDADGSYRTALLPGLRLSVPMLWQNVLPRTLAIGDLLRDMLRAE